MTGKTGTPPSGPQSSQGSSGADGILDQSALALRSALDGLASNIALVNETGEIVFTNKAYRDFAERGGVASAAVSERVNYFAVCDAAEGKDAEYAHAFAGGLRAVAAGTRSSFEMEYPCDSPEERRWFVGRVTPFSDAAHKLLLVSHENITERKRTEEALQLQVKRADVLLELPKLANEYDEKIFMQRGMELTENLTGSTISFIHFINEGDQEIELVAWSRRTLEHYCTAAYDSHYPVSKAGIWADALREGRAITFNDYSNYPHKRGLPEGHSELQRLISVPVIENGRVVMLAGVGNKPTDYSSFDSETVQLIATAIYQIVQKSRSAKIAREAAARLGRLSEHLPGVLYQYQLRPDGTMTVPYASRGIEDLYGVSLEQLATDTSPLFAAIHPDDSTQVHEAIMASARTLGVFRSRHRAVLPDGRTLWIEGEATPERQADGTVLWHGYTSDVTNRTAMDATLRKLTRAVEQSDVTIVVTGADGNIEYANPHFEKSSGYTVQEAVGQNPRILKSGLTPPETYLDLWKTVMAGNEWRGELHNKRKDGSTYWERVVISPVRDAEGVISNFVAVKEDITQRKEMEEKQAKLQAQLNQSQKMESVGRLAGGIAHDFNNLLTVISGTVDLALSSTAPTSPNYEDFAMIQEAAQRATALTRRLLTFSRQGVVQSKDVAVNDVILQTLKMLRRMVSEDVSIVTELAEDSGIVRADVGQLEQVITNLMVNARDAMPRGGRITISTARETLVDGVHAGIAGGDYLRLSVRDTGTGMNSEVMKRLFEPFFTTKAAGKGTGLGLAIVYGIVTQAGGTVTVESTLGDGTAFNVFLPRLAHGAANAHESEAVNFVTGSGLILVVDDEPALGKVTQRILQKAGYTVLRAQSAEDAIALVDGLDQRLELLVSDVIMPDMSGPEVATLLQARDPGLRVLFVSGHSGDILTNFGLDEHEYAFLTKPFSIPDLTGMVKELLSGRET